MKLSVCVISRVGRHTLTLTFSPVSWSLAFERGSKGGVFVNVGPLACAWFSRPKGRLMISKETLFGLDPSAVSLGHAAPVPVWPPSDPVSGRIECDFRNHGPIIRRKDGSLCDLEGRPIVPHRKPRVRTRSDLDRAVMLLLSLRLRAGEDVRHERLSAYSIQKEWMARWGIARVSDLGVS